MIDELIRIENDILKKVDLSISEEEADLECEDYLGYNFRMGKFRVKFRKAKITPKKIGQFVTFWRRNLSGKTEPFSQSDDFDFYIVATQQGTKSGFFIFPKAALTDQQVLTTDQKDGKRGFRVYTTWDTPENRQAEKTQNWQKDFFIDLTRDEAVFIGRFAAIVKEI